MVKRPASAIKRPAVKKALKSPRAARLPVQPLFLQRFSEEASRGKRPCIEVSWRTFGGLSRFDLVDSWKSVGRYFECLFKQLRLYWRFHAQTLYI